MILQSSCGFPLLFRTHYLRHEIYINVLATTTEIVIAMNYLILMLEKYLPFRKGQKDVERKFFPPSSSNWIHALWNYFSNHVYLKDKSKNMKKY